MVRQIQDLLQDYPWIAFAFTAMLLLGVGIAVAVMAALRHREKKHSQPFEVLSQQELPHAGEAQARQPAPPVYEEDGDGMTRRLFDYPDMELKSYQLELYDLNAPGIVYRATITDRITIGRKAQCMICIPNSTLSGQHCEIVLRDGKLFLHDLNSTNGTYLNGNPNRITEEVLGSGSIIEMGSVKLQAKISVIKI